MLNSIQFSLIPEPYVKSSDILYIATTIARNGYNIKQCTIQIEEYQDTDAEHLLNNPLIRSHSLRANNENSIINILT